MELVSVAPGFDIISRLEVLTVLTAGLTLGQDHLLFCSTWLVPTPEATEDLPGTPKCFLTLNLHVRIQKYSTARFHVNSASEHLLPCRSVSLFRKSIAGSDVITL